MEGLEGLNFRSSNTEPSYIYKLKLCLHLASMNKSSVKLKLMYITLGLKKESLVLLRNLITFKVGDISVIYIFFTSNDTAVSTVIYRMFIPSPIYKHWVLCQV